jgi:glucose/arabinose dehydrogenase
VGVVRDGVALALASVALASCTGAPPSTRSAGTPTSNPAGSSTPPVQATATVSPTPAPAVPTRAGLRGVRVRLDRVAYLQNPIALAFARGDESLYVAQRQGTVRAVRDGRLVRAPILDLSSKVSLAGSQGLLGLAFSPEGSQLFVCYTDRAGDLRLVEYGFEHGVVVKGSLREVLEIHIPSASHQGGDVTFGPDGYLWLSVGDGEEGSDPAGNGQSLKTLLGKLLRIDPNPSGEKAYGIPPDNPFNRTGARPEIYAYGLREPWRFSFDRATGDLWLGDVGQYSIEEIDYLAAGSGAGSNFGWNRLEGTKPFSGKAPRNAVPPLAEYSHDTGRCAVIGGYVYRGAAIPALDGAYVYGDLCDGMIRALVQRGGHRAFGRSLGVHIGTLASFGQGPDGELYVLSQFQGLYRLDQA